MSKSTISTFELFALALSFLAGSAPAQAQSFDYLGNSFSVQGQPADHTNLSATIDIFAPLADYETSGVPGLLTIIGGGAAYILVNDGSTSGNSTDDQNGFFVLYAEINSAGDGLDFSKGWYLIAQWYDPAFDYAYISSQYGPSGSPYFSGALDFSGYAPAGWFMSVSYVEGDPGAWALAPPPEPTPVPEPSSFLLALFGFALMGAVQSRFRNGWAEASRSVGRR